MTFQKLLATHAPAAVILIRLIVGAVFLVEGIQKFLYPDALGVGRFTKIGIPAPEILAPFVGLCETVCGALFLLGFLTRFAAITMIIDMLVAISTTKIPILQKEVSGAWRTRPAPTGPCCWGRSSCLSLEQGRGQLMRCLLARSLRKMKTVLETDRLILRVFVMDDLEEFFRMMSDPDITRYTGGGVKTLEEARTRLEERVFADYRKHGYGRWVVVYKATGEVIGFAGLKYLDDVGEVDLGFRLFKQHWGKGLATEASRAILAHGFAKLQLKCIVGIVDKENKASIRVLEKVGFTFKKFTTYMDHEVAWYVLEGAQ